ncbi:type II 3-dehydroquinate dehydratase [Candidatus Vidania fulgoroideorum]
MNILIINGPNMNILEKRGKIYGKCKMHKINKFIKRFFFKKNLKISFYQSNYEGDIISRIHRNNYDFLIINPAGFSYNCYPILDAILAINKKFIEVHITNIFSRKNREITIFSKKALSVISGLNYMGYIYAIDYLYNL